MRDKNRNFVSNGYNKNEPTNVKISYSWLAVEKNNFAPIGYSKLHEFLTYQSTLNKRKPFQNYSEHWTKYVKTLF